MTKLSLFSLLILKKGKINERKFKSIQAYNFSLNIGFFLIFFKKIKTRVLNKLFYKSKL